MLFGVYQDWLHQNPGEHLDIAITKDGKWQNLGVKHVCIPTYQYAVPSRKFGSRFVGILYVGIDGVCARKWNPKCVIVFHLFILQRAQGVNNANHTHAPILFWLNHWNSGAFDELAKDTFNMLRDTWENIVGFKSKEQRHQTFLILVLKGKWLEAVQCVCKW